MTRAEIHAQLDAVHAASDDPRERPILFSAPMVRAILADRKTQTRRIVKPPRCALVHGRRSFPAFCHYDPGLGAGGYLHWAYGGGDYPEGDVVKARVRCPYGGRGDRLWVRETWYDDNALRDTEPVPTAPDEYIYYRADGEAHQQFEQTDGLPLRWRPSIHMPRWASRLTLEVTAVRAERLQAISTLDAMAEGVEPVPATGINGVSYTRAFHRLWDTINGSGPGARWVDSPWVWVISFRRLP